MRSSTAQRWGEVNKPVRSEEHTSELQSQSKLVCRLLLEKKNQSLRTFCFRPQQNPAACLASNRCSPRLPGTKPLSTSYLFHPTLRAANFARTKNPLPPGR